MGLCRHPGSARALRTSLRVIFSRPAITGPILRGEVRSLPARQREAGDRFPDHARGKALAPDRGEARGRHALTKLADVRKQSLVESGFRSFATGRERSIRSAIEAWWSLTRRKRSRGSREQASRRPREPAATPPAARRGPSGSATPGSRSYSSRCQRLSCGARVGSMCRPC